MSLCPSFFCRRCERSHADECAPAAKGPASLHDWEDLAVIDLSMRSVCKTCGLRYTNALIDTMLNQVKTRPVAGCPKKPPF